MVLAMAKPSLNQGSFKALQGDVEVILIVDRSISMRADDIKPTRLDIAKREAFNIEPLLAEGDKTALFIFGKESHRKIYLSERLENIFDRLTKVSFPESLSGDGLIWDSDFAVMLENVYQSMDRQDAHNEGYFGKKYIPKKRSNRIVIIFSDGEDQFKKEKPTTPAEVEYHKNYVKRLNNALSEFKKRGLKIYPVGIGTQKGVKWFSLLRGYKKDQTFYGEEGGSMVQRFDYNEESLIKQGWQNGVSRIDKENLVFLARSTGAELGGNIWTIENGATTVKNYLSTVINSNRKALLEFSQSEDEQDLWQYFLLGAVGILALGIFFHPISGYFSRKRR